MEELYKRKELCCGCGACVQACPKQCITMEEDEEGFLYPSVDVSRCVNCGICGKVCPISAETAAGDADTVMGAYVAYAKDEGTRLASSSGGIFSLLAEEFLESGGVVFGAAFDADFMVHHMPVATLGDLVQLRGSKYIQSRIENTFIEAKSYLQEGRQVLFTGTACQIAGLKAFLGREYDNLMTVDVLCHGVPSPKLWKRYLDGQENRHGAALRQMTFRHKKYGWKSYAVSLEFSNDTAYVEKYYNDPFMRLFLSNICLRPSCHECRFKAFPRPSDMTIGDCWGVEKHSPEMDDDRGASVVIVNSEKGMRMKESIFGKCEWKEGELDVLLPEDADSRKSVDRHRNRDTFFRKLNRGSRTDRLIRLITPSFWSRASRKTILYARRYISRMQKKR